MQLSTRGAFSYTYVSMLHYTVVENDFDNRVRFTRSWKSTEIDEDTLAVSLLRFRRSCFPRWART